jgi:hypothetical protein
LSFVCIHARSESAAPSCFFLFFRFQILCSPFVLITDPPTKLSLLLFCQNQLATCVRDASPRFASSFEVSSPVFCLSVRTGACMHMTA